MNALVSPHLLSSHSLARIVPAVVGALFVYAGMTKAFDVRGFAASINAYNLTGSFANSLLACILPYLEIMTGALLVAGYKKKEALIIIIGLSMVFTGAIIYAIIAGLKISCGCFASGPEPGALYLSVVRNIFIISACVFCLLRKERVNAA